MRLVCRVLNISEQRYYYRRRNPKKSKYTEQDKQIVRDMFHKHNCSFGRRMLKKYLERENIIFSEQKISNIMKELGLVAKYGRPKIKNVYTHKEVNKKYISENIYNNLSEKEKEALNVWSIDFTEQKIKEAKVYTCAIINVKTKVLVGHKQSLKKDAKLAVKTLKDAIDKFKAPDMIMSDRGAEFISKLFQTELKEQGITSSMSRPYKPVDNIFIETFFKSFKVEIGYVKNYTLEENKMVSDYWIHYYNNERIHSAIGYKTPMEYHNELNGIRH